MTFNLLMRGISQVFILHSNFFISNFISVWVFFTVFFFVKSYFQVLNCSHYFCVFIVVMKTCIDIILTYLNMFSYCFEVCVFLCFRYIAFLMAYCNRVTRVWRRHTTLVAHICAFALGYRHLVCLSVDNWSHLCWFHAPFFACCCSLQGLVNCGSYHVPGKEFLWVGASQKNRDGLEGKAKRGGGKEPGDRAESTLRGWRWSWRRDSWGRLQ